MIESLESFANGALAVLGISFLIFMHELGHFAAARLFGVRVETFSIGFGRRLFGFHRGGTEYRVALIPLGGYVKMAGEYGDFEEGEHLDPSDLTAKPIWQRFVIFSAGVVVNIVLAFIVFPIAFGLGVPFTTPVVGTVLAGGPAWQAGVESGDEILRVDDRDVYGYSDVGLEVALADPEHTELRVRRDGREFNIVLHTERFDGRWDAGLLPRSSGALIVPPDGPAARAGLAQGDELLAVNGVAVGDLRFGTRLGPGELLRRARDGGGPLRLRVKRDDREIEASVLPETRENEEGPRLLGARPLARRVAATRRAAAAPDFPVLAGDVIEAANGLTVLSPDAIQDAAQGPALTLTVRRDGASLDLTLDDSQRLAVLGGDLAFGGDESSTYVQPIPGGALEAAGVVTGDRIVSLDGEPLADYTTLLERLRAAGDNVVDFRVGYEHDGQLVDARVRTRPPPLLDYGLDLQFAEVVHDLGLLGSLRAGWNASLNALRTTALTLGKLFTGSVGMKNLGGPLSISFITYKSAEWDFAKLLFFLALLSVNLGFINILPIPVLDGGQIVFLLCEKVKGSRLSERFLQNAQLVGLVAILALMVVVTYNDILRFLG